MIVSTFPLSASDQSCLNRFLTEVDRDVDAVNDVRIEMMQLSEDTRFHGRGVIGLDDVLLDKTGKFVKDSGTFWTTPNSDTNMPRT